MAGTPEYQEVAFGAGNQSWAPGRRMSDAADMLGYTSLEQRLKALLGSSGEAPTAGAAVPGQGTPGPSPMPTPGGPESMTGTADTMSEEEKRQFAEQMRQQLAQPSPTPTSTPGLTDRLTQMLGSGRK